MEFKQARLRMGLTVSALAKSYGVSSSTIRRWENGKRPTIKTLAKIIQSWTAKEQFAFFSYMTSGPWKNTAESPIGSPLVKDLLELLKRKIEIEDSTLKQAA